MTTKRHTTMRRALMGALAIAGAIGGAMPAQAYPIDAGLFTCESVRSKTQAKYFAAGMKCVLKCEAGARKGANPFSDCIPPFGGAALSCFEDAAKGAFAKASATVAAACGAACPNCFQMPGCLGSNVMSPADIQLRRLVPTITCENATDPLEAKCMDGNWKAIVKYIGSAGKCIDKCMALAQHGTVSDGTCLGFAEPKEEKCVSAAMVKAASIIDKLCWASGSHPACYDGLVHPPATLFSPDDANTWVQLGQYEMLVNLLPTYCGS